MEPRKQNRNLIRKKEKSRKRNKQKKRRKLKMKKKGQVENIRNMKSRSLLILKILKRDLMNSSLILIIMEVLNQKVLF